MSDRWEVLVRKGHSERNAVSHDNTLWVAVGLFVPAMLAGAAMARLHWRARTPPWLLTALHGLFVVGGIICLILAASPFTALARFHAILALFLLAAVGGVGILSFHIRKRTPPKFLLAAHASGALAAFTLLLLYLLRVIDR